MNRLGVLTCCLVLLLSVAVVRAAEKSLTLITHDSFNLSTELVAGFREGGQAPLPESWRCRSRAGSGDFG